MLSNLQLVEKPRKTLSMNPKKFILWLFMVSIIMLFAAMTSAYIVRQAEGNWLDFTLPNLFWFNTVVLLISSATIHWAYLSVKKDALDIARLATGITAALGIVFLVGQVYAWGALVDKDVFFVGNPAGSFLYVITGLHAVHIISGLVFLVITFVAVTRFKVHSKKPTLMQLCATFWHFLDALWLYLFIFLLLNR